MILELLALASLLRLDPSGDAHGAGDLVPPSATLYADRSAFDLVEVDVGGDEVLTVRVTLAGIPNPGGLPNGLTLPVLDVYLDLDEGGETLALPGVGMAMAERHGWEVAIRVHGDDAYLRMAEDPDGTARPVAVAKDGSALVLTTTLPVPDDIRDVQVVTGVYDPFRSDAWRPLSVLPSPWAFSSETAAPPVVDLLAPSDAVQREAIRSYVLPTSRRDAGPVGWLLLMFGGLGVAAGGLWLRRRASSRPVFAGDATPTSETVAGASSLDGEAEGSREGGEAAGETTAGEATAGEAEATEAPLVAPSLNPDVPIGRAGRGVGTKREQGVTSGAVTQETPVPADKDDRGSTAPARPSWSRDGWTDEDEPSVDRSLLETAETDDDEAWVGGARDHVGDAAAAGDAGAAQGTENAQGASFPDDQDDRARKLGSVDASPSGDEGSHANATPSEGAAATPVPRYRIKDWKAKKRAEAAADGPPTEPSDDRSPDPEPPSGETDETGSADPDATPNPDDAMDAQGDANRDDDTRER